jgi:hypothetical protein
MRALHDVTHTGEPCEHPWRERVENRVRVLFSGRAIFSLLDSLSVYDAGRPCSCFRWVNCLPESPCQDLSVENVSAPGAHGWVCENAQGPGLAQHCGL